MKISDFKGSIPEIERILGYTFRDKSLLTQAFTRSSWCNEQQDSSYRSNEVLEFFGDSVLSVAIISFLLSKCTERYKHGIMTELGEGDFSNIKSKLSDKTNLSRSTKKLGLEKFLLLGEGDTKLGIAEEPSVMEDLFESIIGAIYIDSDKDISAVSRVVARILDMSVYTDKNPAAISPKNALQEYCADKKRRLPPPVYKTVSEEGPDHKKIYERGVYIGDRLIAVAKGKNQKIADSLAAERALEILLGEEKPKAQNTPKAKKSAEPTVKDAPTKPKAKKAPKKDTRKQPEPKERSASAAQEAAKKPSPTPSGSEAAKLRAYALSHSVATPTFRDLGITRREGGDLEYSIECSFMSKRAVAKATSRPDAREKAAMLVARALGIK